MLCDGRDKKIWARFLDSVKRIRQSMTYSILFYSILFYSILFYSILFYSILFYSILFYSILFYLECILSRMHSIPEMRKDTRKDFQVLVPA